MRVGVIGDIHGHYREMVSIIRELERHRVDRIIQLGDLCDRGPDPLLCLNYAREDSFIDRSGHIRPIEVVKGNHEDAYVRHWRGLSKPGCRGVANPGEISLYKRLSREVLEWMESLPFYIEIPELHLVCLHGGVTPHYTTLDIAGVLRARYLNENYRARGPSGDIFWAEVYDGRFGTIVFGHESHERPTLYDSAVAVDGEGFKKVHAVVFSDEARDDDLRTAFSCHYGGEPFRETFSYDPIRYYSMEWFTESRSLLP